MSKLREQLKDASAKRAALARGKAAGPEAGSLDKLAAAAESRGDIEARAIEEAHTREEEERIMLARAERLVKAEARAQDLAREREVADREAAVAAQAQAA